MLVNFLFKKNSAQNSDLIPWKFSDKIKAFAEGWRESAQIRWNFDNIFRGRELCQFHCFPKKKMERLLQPKANYLHRKSLEKIEDEK